jgi:hypothetical protein
MPSVQANLIVHQHHQRIEFHARAADGSWQAPSLLNAEDTVRLPCIDASLTVAELYA